jgi:Uma2 family endonuclease
MTVDEFLAWAEGRPERYELFRGEVYAMSPETVGHTKVKGTVYQALIAGVRQSGLRCHVLTDGPTLRVDEVTAYEPDALVYCGKELPPSAIEVPDPVIVVEVLPPSTRGVDVSLKLAGYSGCRAWRITSLSIPRNHRSFIMRVARATTSSRASSPGEASRSIRPGLS